jgi:hypothetical protein
MRKTLEDLDVLARFQCFPKELAGTTSVQSYLRSRLKKWKNQEKGKNDWCEEFLKSEENKAFGASSSDDIEPKFKLMKDNASRVQRLAVVGRLGDAAQCLIANGVYLIANGVYSDEEPGIKEKIISNWSLG